MAPKNPAMFVAATSLALLMSSPVACAEDAAPTIPDHPVMKDRFFIGAGVLWAESNVTANLNSGRVGVGALIDFEDDMGLQETNAIAMLTFRWRISKRWQLEAEYFNLDRDNEKQVSRTLEWGDRSFPVNAVVRSKFELEDIRVGVGYSFFRTQDKEIGIGLGAHVTSLDASLGTANFGTQAASESAPLPFLNLYARMALTDRWLLNVRVDRLSLDTGDIDGRIFSSGTDFIYQPWRHVAIGLGYRDINFEVNSNGSDWRGKAQIQQTGPYLFVAGTF